MSYIFVLIFETVFQINYSKSELYSHEILKNSPSRSLLVKKCLNFKASEDGATW